MKTDRLFIFALTVSLAANATLGIAFMRHPSTRMDETSEGASTAPPLAAAPAQETAPAPRRGQHGGTTLWEIVGSANQESLIAHLRKAGFSSRQIRAIAQHLVQEKYRSRMIDAYGAGRGAPYWKTSNIVYSGDKAAADRRKLRQEMTRELKALLGDAYTAVDEQNEPYFKSQYGTLPRAKLEKLLQIQQDYAELRGELGTGPAMLPADREKMALLMKEQRADMERLLTPAELFEYDLRNAPAAWRLKNNNNEVLNLTESEYRALFPLFNSIENELSQNTGANFQEVQKAREAAEAKIQDQIKAALGEARYADYQQANDKEAQQENRLVTRLGLPLSTANQLVELKKEYRDLSRTINSDKSLPPETRKEQLAVLTRESETKVKSLIGERGLDAYREYGGSWLRMPSVRVIRSSTPVPHP